MQPQTQEYAGSHAGQWEKTQSLLRYVSSKVPYYQRLFRKLGLQPSDVRSVQDFRKLPYLTKQTIQQQWDDFVSQDHRGDDLVVRYTSGSTGTPLKIVHTRLERVIAGRHMMRARMKWGLHLPARWAILGGAIHFVSGIEERVRRGKKGGEDVLRLSCLDLSTSTLQHYVQELEAFQPAWIYSLPSTLDRMAQSILSRGHPVLLHDICLIELAGEYLSPEARQRIRKAFQYPPANQYACRELWGIAFECPERGMHVLDEHVYLEVVKEDGTPAGPGELGETVITSLNSRAMPFIRYRLGDVVMPLAEQCSCGDSRPLIEMVGGRTADFIVGQPGKLGNIIFDSLFNYLHLQGYQGVQEFRVVQRSETCFEVWVIRTSSWGQETPEVFERKARNVLGENVRFDFKFVDQIPPLPSGKTQSFVVDLL